MRPAHRVHGWRRWQRYMHRSRWLQHWSWRLQHYLRQSRWLQRWSWRLQQHAHRSRRLLHRVDWSRRLQHYTDQARRLRHYVRRSRWFQHWSRRLQDYTEQARRWLHRVDWSGRSQHYAHRSLTSRWMLPCAALVVVLVCGVADALVTQVRLHHTEVRLRATSTALATTSARLAAASRALAAATGSRQANQLILNDLSPELSAAEQHLVRAKQGLDLQNLDIAALNACLTGVQRAVGDMQSSQRQAAIDAIGGAADACEHVEGGGLGGPVYPYDFPDPDVIDAGGTYFGYGTNAAGGNIQIIESPDLSHWRTVGDALPRLASWATPGLTWAPGVLQLGQTFLLYYATKAGSGADAPQCLSVASADAPGGPFTDSSPGPLVCQRARGGAIDPAPYTDGEGHPYLTWKSNGGSGQPPTIWAQALDPSGTRMAPHSTPSALLQPSQPWEGGVVEGPSMWSSGGVYHLFYSGNSWNSASYAEGMAVCQGPLGPCGKPLGGPVLASQTNLAGPGGASVFTDAQGNPWLAFHAWLPQAVGYPNARLLFLRRLAFSNGVPDVVPAG